MRHPFSGRLVAAPGLRSVAAGLLLLGAAATSACRGGATGGVDSILLAGDAVILQRVLPESLGEGAMAVVVKTAGGPIELRLVERHGGSALVVKHTSRPGDEFRNLSVDDLTGDGRPEVVSTWIGGQLEVIEVLGRGKDGGWTVLLQNAGQTVETRRRSDHIAAFWITSRTYEETTGQPPVYQTTIFEWNGTAFAEAGANGGLPPGSGAEQPVPAMSSRH